MKKITESKNPLSNTLDRMSVSEIVKLINKEDIQVPKIINKNLDIINIVIRNVIDSLRNNGRLFYIGCGTSGRLGVLDASECPPTFKTDPSTVQGIIAGGYDALYKSIEGAEDSFSDGVEIVNKKNISQNDSVIGISASGTADYVLGALSEAKKVNAFTCLITFNEISKKYRFIDQVISYNLGPEIISGSTRLKSGTATKMILNMISTTSMVKSNKVYKNYMVDLKVSNKKLKERALSIICEITKLNREDSLKLLNEAKNDVKIALVIHHCKISYNSASKLINSNNGNLRKILE